MKYIAIKLAGVFTILFAFTATIARAAPSFTEVDLDADPRWDVTYQGSSYDSAQNQTTFVYSVEVYDDPALSHFTIGFPLCDNLTVVDYYPTDAVSIGLDPTTGVYGIKWDLGLDPGNSETYSFTLQGQIAEGLVDVAVKAGQFAALGERTGASCETIVSNDTYDISGTLFVDADRDGSLGAGEPILSNVTVALYDLAGNLISTTITNADGSYTFNGLPAGDYVIGVPSVTDAIDFNENLSTYFDATTSTSISVGLDNADSTDNNFGFAPDVSDLLDDIRQDDPDGDGFTFSGNGKTIGFWKHQLAVSIKGKGRAQIDAVAMESYIAQIEALYLAEPYQFGGSFEEAFVILKSTSSDAVDLLSKQLLGTEFNEVAGYGLSDEFDQLQSVLVAWGEYLVANNLSFSRDDLISAKDIFDGINNTGNF